MTREEQVARETQVREIPPAAAQDKTEAASASAEISRLQDEVALCRQRIASYPSEIQ
ncbi:unnamed protein product, partial [Ascophyllum nodosum]